ncbi:unnamed protein product [Peniophora sp. CBMAI 1063]|nr:unnamed protein product [Peniophora sp. CBMAI 1063]
MILDTLGIDYVILEANERVGGRIYTHRFNDDPIEGINANIGDPARYDYVDIGAMRFPNIGFMKRVFDLFDTLDLRKDGLLIEYKYSSPNTYLHYNGRRRHTADIVPQLNGQYDDFFSVSSENGGAVPGNYVAQGVDRVLGDVFRPYADLFNDPNTTFQEAWAHLQQEGPYSTRAHMLGRASPTLPEAVIQWLETFSSATGLYNNAFVESAMDAIDFGSVTAAPQSAGGLPKEEVNYAWYCIDGGSDHIIRRMVDGISTTPLTKHRVTKIKSTEDGTMQVTYLNPGGMTLQEELSQVICTVPLGCLADIEIPVGDISYLQRMAIRSLNYDTSTKIALKFRTRWWEDPAVMGERTIEGGVSSSDIPIRTCVYPSYGFTATGTVTGVMLASYTWAQDAQRLGGLSQGKGSEADRLLIDLTLRNLSQLHGIPIEKFGPLLDYYTYNWHDDENARGAFALFGPGQFSHHDPGSSLFASIKAPAAGGKLHIAGEATSVHHAWVLGSLNSAWRAVYNALGRRENAEQLREEMRAKWDVPEEENPDDLLKLALLSYHGCL